MAKKMVQRKLNTTPGLSNSTIHAQTAIDYQKNVEQGLYYNASKDIESFIQVYNSENDKDSFATLNDSTLSGFKMFFHFGANSGLLADDTNINSALAYLKRIGHQSRYETLQRFIVHLSRLNSECPWLFQKITGLQEAYINPFSNVQKKITIDIETMETIDGKMTSLFQMYRYIVWDDLRDVWVLPVNLRRFSMSIYVYDYRMFSSSSTSAIEFLQTVNNTDIRQINHVLFELGYCEFTNESGKAYFDNISNVDGEFANSNINITSEQLSMSSLFRTISGNAKDSSDILTIKPFVYAAGGTAGENEDEVDKFDIFGKARRIIDAKTPPWLTNIKDRIMSSDIIKKYEDQYNLLRDKDTWINEFERLKDNLTEAAIKKLETQVAKLYLGNVNGFGFQDILGIGMNGIGGGSVGPTGIVEGLLNSTVYREARTKSMNLKTNGQVKGNVDDDEDDPSEHLVDYTR